MTGPRKEGVEAALDADAAYEAIRESKTDVQQIAASTGLKANNVRKVKDHLFMRPHRLDRYEHLGIPAEMRLFDSDKRIAEAWERLQTVGFTPADIQLLRHEAAEAWYMRRHGPGYSAAHEKAQRLFPSPLD